MSPPAGTASSMALWRGFATHRGQRFFEEPLGPAGKILKREECEIMLAPTTACGAGQRGVLVNLGV